MSRRIKLLSLARLTVISCRILDVYAARSINEHSSSRDVGLISLLMLTIASPFGKSPLYTRMNTHLCHNVTEKKRVAYPFTRAPLPARSSFLVVPAPNQPGPL